MSAFEFNKIVGAILFTALVVIGANVLTNHIYGPAEHGKAREGEAVPPATPSGEEPAPAAEVGAVVEPVEAGAPAEAAAEETPLAVLLAAASVEAGEKAAKKCGTCHSFEKGAGAKVGPDLWDIVGRPVAGADGFSYSDALKGLGGNWTFDRLFAFIADPKAYTPGTKMSFPGVRNANERADILAYLRSLSDSPAPLPAAPSQPAE